MNSIVGTQTEKNLLKAFAGESQAKNRYEFLPSKPKKKVCTKLPLFLKKRL